jgi:hypothetical protein
VSTSHGLPQFDDSTRLDGSGDSCSGVVLADPRTVSGGLRISPETQTLAALRPRLSDTFRNAGRGWGATGTNEYPLFRVGQIWTSDSLQAESVTVRKTLHSDHRMVVCDLTFEAP